MKSKGGLSCAGLLALTLSVQIHAGDYQIIDRGAHSKTWQRQDLDEAGQSVIHNYVEWETGMHYFDQGEWKESVPQFEEFKGKGFVARRGLIQAVLSPILEAGCAEVVVEAGRFRGGCIGLSFYDPASGQSLVLAAMKAVPGELIAPNQVLYPDCFEGEAVSGSVLYTLTKCSLEQYVILHKPLGVQPADLGFSPHTRLAAITEWLDLPPVKISQQLLRREDNPTLRAQLAEPDLADDQLNFGDTIQIGPGKAFSLNNGVEVSTDSIPIAKRFESDQNRSVLFEEVEFESIKPLLEQLRTSRAPEKTRTAAVGEYWRSRISPGRKAPRAVFAPVEKPVKAAQLAALTGVVLDYQILASANNVTLSGGTTYYVTGPVVLSGTTTIEAGTVVKFANSGNPKIQMSGAVVCKTTAYRPAIFSAKDDDNVGESLPGSSGAPSGSYAVQALYSPSSTTGELHDLVIRHAVYGIEWWNSSARFANLQLVNCLYPVRRMNCTAPMHNILVVKATTAFLGGTVTYDLEHLTLDQCANFAALSPTPGVVNLTNSILSLVTNLGSYSQLNANYNGLYNAPAITQAVGFTSPVNPFQTAGAGGHYLASGLGWRNVGTTNLNSSLLASLRLKTTYAPSLCTNAISQDTVWLPQVQRDTDPPDLGYHYEPLDYLVNAVTVNGATLTLSNGVAVGIYGDCGFKLQAGGKLISEGSPTVLNRLARFPAVQSLINTAWNQTGTLAFFKEDAPSGTQPEVRLRFTGLSALAGGGTYLSGGNQLGTLALSDCQFNGGVLALNVTGSTGRTLALTNNLWDQATLTIGNGSDPLTLYAYNNTFNLGSISFLPVAGNSWVIRDNYFHQLQQLITNANLTGANHNYNGYYTGFARLTPNGPNDQIMTAAPFTTGPLGAFYLNSGGLYVFSDHGSRTAAAAGLYHYTTRATQEKESTSQVDIGFHYVAVDSQGRPLDYDGDGLPDYLEDRNGNGVADAGAGETDWQTSNNGMGGAAALQVFTPLK